MVDLQSVAAAASLSAASSVAPASGLSAIQVSVSDITQALENLTRSIQTNATPVALSDTGNALEVTLATTFGSLTVALTQKLGAVEKQNLTRQLLNMIDTQKPLTLALQPGAPPTQAVLLLPGNAAAAPAANPGNSATSSPLPAAAPLAAGETVTAIVIPPLTAPQPVNPAANLLAQAIPVLPAEILAPDNFTPSALPPAAGAPAAPTAPAAGPAVSPQSSPAPNIPLAGNNPASVTPAATAAPITQPPPGAVARAAPAAPVAATVSAVPVFSAAPDPATNIAQTQNPAIAQTSPAVIPNAPSTSAIPTSAPAPPANLLQPGNEVSLHIDSIRPPNISPASPPPLAPNQVAATVIGAGANGNLILKAGDATLFVKAPVTAPVGTTVIVSVGSAPTAAPLTLPGTAPANFSALPQALATLAQTAPQILQQIMANHIAQPTQALPGALLFLFSAFKQGNLRGWLGEDAVESLLRMGKSDLIASLTRELGDAGQPAQDMLVGQWKSFPIPLFAQQQFQALTLYVHNDRDGRSQADNGKGGAPDKIRFLIDLRLSKLGSMQMDGFIQPRKMDMILRSENNLPDGLHQELRDSYQKAMGAVGYGGTLNFQVGRKHWLTMQQQAQGITT